MGQVFGSMYNYRAKNEANAIQSLYFLDTPLNWHRLDDAVMGGKSETCHIESTDKELHFMGTINTNGGGFASIRAPLEKGLLPQKMEAIRIKFRGDGKTYKVLLACGTAKTIFSMSTSWQADLSTSKRGDDDDFEEAVLPLNYFVPSFGGSPLKKPEDESLILQDVNELGLMLSLHLSDCTANPPETFGEGKFDFKLTVKSIEAVLSPVDENTDARD